MIEHLAHPAARRVAIALTAAVLFAGITAAIAHDDTSIPAGGARLTAVVSATVVHTDGTSTNVRGSSSLRAGDVVEASGGAITILLADGTTLEGRPATHDASATKVQIGAPVLLQAGDLLVASSTAPIIDAAGNKVHLASGDVAARIERGLAVSTAIYRGSAEVDSAGQQRVVPALRQLDISVLGRPPADPKAMTVDPADPWDLRYLGPAIELTRTLDALSRSYSASLPVSQATSAAFLRTAVPGLAGQSDVASLFAQRCTDKAGETLVGAVIAVLGTNGAFADRWQHTFDFRCGSDHGGAGWGLVAMDQGVAGDRIISMVEQALGGAPGQLTEGVTPTTDPAGTDGVTPTTSASGGSAATTTTTAPNGNGGGTPTTPPITVPPVTVPPVTLPPPPATGVPIVDTLVDTVGALLGGLLGPRK